MSSSVDFWYLKVIPLHTILNIHSPPDLTKSNGARSVAVGLLHTSSGRGRLPSSFGGKLEITIVKQEARAT